MDEATVTTTLSKQCKHQNGWYVFPTFLCFKRKYLVCSDCGKLIAQTKWYLN